MYLVKTKKDYIICSSAEEVKKYNKSEIIELYTINRVDYDNVVSTGDIRDAIYSFLKGEQHEKDEVLEFISVNLNVKTSEVSKVITAMKKEKIIYVVEEFGWLGIN